jgi:hypothetical protein
VPLEQPQEGSSGTISTILAALGQLAFSLFTLTLHHSQTTIRVAGSTRGAGPIFIKIFFAHDVPNLFLCSWYLVCAIAGICFGDQESLRDWPQ